MACATDRDCQESGDHERIHALLTERFGGRKSVVASESGAETAEEGEGTGFGSI
jgi:hypothetical protein